MPRLQTFELKIQTGEAGRSDVPKYAINGFELDFDEVKGGVGAGETLEAVGMPDSFPHALVLRGPREGTWRIESMSATYYPLGEEPYTVRFAPIELDSESDLDIWQPRPEPVFDV